jgi:hypothetical protein
MVPLRRSCNVPLYLAMSLSTNNRCPGPALLQLHESYQHLLVRSSLAVPTVRARRKLKRAGTITRQERDDEVREYNMSRDFITDMSA